jgi:Flp pilus assembly protein TadG
MRHLYRKGIHNNNERGMALVTTALSLVFLTLFVGLAVDVSALYVVKGRLSAAVDAASLGAGRTLNLGVDIASAQSYADAAGKTFFKANFPDGYMGTNPASTVVTSNFTALSNGSVRVTVNASVRAPIIFLKTMRVVGLPVGDTVTVSSTGTATRRGLVLILVLDKSGSMMDVPGNTPCTDMKTAAKDFTKNFSAYDSVGLVTFETKATVDAPAGANWKTNIQAKINGINCNGSTNTTGALYLAGQEIQRVNLQLALNTIVLFTDGMPNGVTAQFPLRTQKDNRYGPYGYPSQNNTGALVANMPVNPNCTGTSVRGLISQGNSFLGTGGTNGLAQSLYTDSAPTLPAGCDTGGQNIRQAIAYIPDVDAFGNSTHGFKDDWVYPVNMQTSPIPGIVPASRFMGGPYSSYPGVATGSNFFTAGPYIGKWRPDQPTTIGAAGMNTADNMARAIRANTTYKVMIHSIYLISGSGGGSDPGERYFLPRVSNLPKIPPSPYDPIGTPDVDNPAYDPSQQTGLFFAATNSSQISSLFNTIASSLLRLSQ